jgi:hypothetical protein
MIGEICLVRVVFSLPQYSHLNLVIDTCTKTLGNVPASTSDRVKWRTQIIVDDLVSAFKYTRTGRTDSIISFC